MLKLVSKNWTPKAGSRNSWLPILVGVLLCIVVALLWSSLDKEEENKRILLIKIANSNFIKRIESDLLNKIPSISRLVERWQIRGGIPESEFKFEAQSFYNDWPGLQAIEWVDRNYTVKWVVPLTGNEKAVDLNLAFEEERKTALDLAREKRAPTMTASIDLVQGGKGFLVYFPIYIGLEFDGFVLLVFRIEQWMKTLMQSGLLNESNDFFHYVSLNGVPVFSHEKGSVSGSEFLINDSLYMFDNYFSIETKPTNQFIEESRSIFPTLLAGVGFILSILISFVIFLAQKSLLETWIAHSTKEALEKEIIEHNKTEEMLEHTNSRLILATKAGQIGIWEWNIVTDSLHWNDIMYQMYNIHTDHIPTYETWRNSVHPEDLPAAEKLLNDAVEGTAKFDTEFRLISRDGIKRIVRTIASIERGDDGSPLIMTGVNWDITKRKNAESLLKIERRRLGDILEGTNVGTWEWNIQTGEVIFNERWANILGYTLKELAPIDIKTWMKFANPDDLKESKVLLQKHFSKEIPYYEYEARMKHKEGHWVWVLDRGKVSTWTETGEPLLMSGTHADITRKKEYEEQILHMASHDALTDLPSLRLVEDRALMSINRSRRNKTHTAILFVDLDGFKAINDTFGHDSGDVVLQETSKRLLSCVRNTDTVARIGGDEFLIVLADLLDLHKIDVIAKKIIDQVSQPIGFSKNSLQVGTSIGISIFPEDGDNIEKLIKKADDAMYKIKKSGKNNFTFA